MALFFQFLGAIFLAIIVVLIAGALFLRFKVRRFLKMIREAGEASAFKPPDEVHLREMVTPCWVDEVEVMSRVESLPSLGFQPIGLYQTAEIEGLNLASFMNPSDRAYAVVYEYPDIGTWVDFVSRFEDGTSFTYANSMTVEGITHRPGVVVERFPDLDSIQLYRKFLADRPERSVKSPTRDGFVAEFEKAYAEDMAWQSQRSSAAPFGRAVLSAMVEDDGDDAGEDLDELEEAITARYLAETTLTAAEWEKRRDRVIVVHESLTPDDLESILLDYIDDLDATPTRPLREWFANFNEGRRPRERFESLGSVQEPTRADLYVAPES